MAMETLMDFRDAVEDYVRAQAGDRIFADDYDDPIDMSNNHVGALLESTQNQPFFIYVVDFDRRSAKISRDAPKRIFGAVQLYSATKDTRGYRDARRELETLCEWFADDNRFGARFRGINFTGQIRRRGFLMFAAEVPFEFDQFKAATKGT